MLYKEYFLHLLGFTYQRKGWFYSENREYRVRISYTAGVYWLTILVYHPSLNRNPIRCSYHYRMSGSVQMRPSDNYQWVVNHFKERGYEPALTFEFRRKLQLLIAD